MIYFIGAGPGDPELITVKGKKILSQADIAIYAGSLVNIEVLEFAKSDCVVYNSAYMTLEEVIAIMSEGHQNGETVVRLHTGDPSVYGALREQMRELDKRGMEYKVIPGVSSFLAAAAALKKEYTLPGVTQTVILTRMEGRTGVPASEDIASLAAHNATMIIFLSIGMIDELIERLKQGYGGDTPAAVVYKASWPEQKIVMGTVDDIAEKAKREGINKTALLAVGNFLGDEYELSRLYDSGFTHEYRRGTE
ncbi:cobalt-precorrin 4 C11-methyltransferase [Anaerobacterium chartisolvens]|uniref:Cobalt-precorrin 4 C11-methyltransferase n=1 Tax=Anaerobacterium chartisolvens TaxID=1297424 RepID=A0A369BAI4_9FIRM|nr:precorrin-4 C(11)-methyltransferase [Anaerobacterium chartisolvens]RCX17576.1 cobalt-precorrin 4 C11-methyltransferase [Anaerobacterium chartisolvens]